MGGWAQLAFATSRCSHSQRSSLLLRNGFAAMMLLLPPPWSCANSQSSLLNFMGSKGTHQNCFSRPGGLIVLILMTPAYNSFAYENAGVQTYFTAPLRFREVFLGKICSSCLIVIELGVVHCGRFGYRVGTPVAPIFLATLRL